MRHRSFFSTMRHVARDVARAERARQREQHRLEAAKIRAVRQAGQQARASAKEAAKLYVESRIEEAAELSQEIQDRENSIANLLTQALQNKPTIDPLAEARVFEALEFDDTPWKSKLPNIGDFLPSPPGFFARMLPGAAQRHEQENKAAEERHREAVAVHEGMLRARSDAFERFQAEQATKKFEIDQHNQDVRETAGKLYAGEHSAVVNFYSKLISAGLLGEPDAMSAEIGYAPDSRHLVVDLELPDIAAVPEEVSFKYNKSADRIDPVLRPLAKRRALYSNLLSQVVLKSVDTLFRGGIGGVVDCLTLNGMLETVDPATGQDVRVCVISVRITSDVFKTLNLALVQPEQCLRSLKASVSRSPAELLPVKPIVELDMIDPRFVDTVDVMSGLEQRPNLMDLSPSEFEGLITNLFAAMGLDTRQTRPSRDGGVDCVAFDPRPVFGGKVVIQAKRYKNTVGVSAVRDLFGTVQNEGASKGILVTTSGYGKAAFEFAAGKPLELLDGGNLLHLLAEHANVEARIVMPEGWNDLPIHGE